jgi:hypothetical protein
MIMNRFEASARKAARLAPLLWCLGVAATAQSRAALPGPPVESREAVTAALQEIWEMSPPAAARKSAELRARRAGSAGEATGLLFAVALERAGDPGAAEAYRALLAGGPATPWGAAARARLRQLANAGESGASGDPDDLEEELSKEPEAAGWFLVGSRWKWTTLRRASLESLLAARSESLSIRFLELVRSWSTFPTAYGYLFVFLALTLGIKVLSLPLYVKSAQSAAKLRALQPEIERIRFDHGSDPAELHRQLAALWQRQGLSPMNGCAVMVVDLIFVIWALVTLADFMPRLMLDGARFGWATDLSRPDLGILLLWLGVSVIQGTVAAFRLPAQGAQMVIGGLLFGLVFVGVAWFGDWPAYLLIFWGLLTLLGLLLNAILVPIFARVG